VVLRCEHRNSLAAQDRPGIPTVGDVHLREADKGADGGGAAAFLRLVGELRQVPHHLVDAQEAGAYALHVVAPNKLLGADDAVQKMLGTVLGHLGSGMSIEDGKEAPVLQNISQPGTSVVGVLHFGPPSLHRADPEEQFVALALVIVLGGFRLIQESAHVH